MTAEEALKIIGVNKKYTHEELAYNYKILLKKYHPDTFRGDKLYATEKTMQIVTAYKHLANNITNTIEYKKENKKKSPKKQGVNKKRIKKTQKTKFPIKAIEADVVVIIVLFIVLIFLLIIFFAI